MSESEQVNLKSLSVSNDPGTVAVARIYAEAFVGASKKNNVEQSLEEFSSFIADVLGTQPVFASLLLENLTSRDEKLGIIDRTVTKFASEAFANFLKVLAHHDRLELLPTILDQAQLVYEEQLGRKRVQVTSAHELTEETLTKISERLNQALPFEPIIEPSVDSSLIGGLVIQVGDRVYDTSLRAQLKQLRTRLRERTLNEIQSGRDRFSYPDGD